MTPENVPELSNTWNDINSILTKIASADDRLGSVVKVLIKDIDEILQIYSQPRVKDCIH